MSTPYVTSGEDQRKDVVRFCLDFGFEGVSRLLQNNTGIGGTPPNKIDDQRSWDSVNSSQVDVHLQISRQLKNFVLRFYIYLSDMVKFLV